MLSAESNYNQAKFLESRILHPFSLQGMTYKAFIEVSNKILSGEIGIIPLRSTQKNSDAQAI
jgi:hypothetical protein